MNRQRYDFSIQKLEVPKGSTCIYALDDNWNITDTIYAIENGVHYYPVIIKKEGENVVAVNGETEGIEVLENMEVEITVSNSQQFPYCMVIQNNCERTNTILKDGKYVFNASVRYKDNIVSTYCYTSKDISLSTSGTLLDQIGIENIDSVECLKVSGDINGTDILTIRKMEKLRLLDLSNAHIVNGGMSYYDNYKTSENTIGEHFYDGLKNLIRIKLPQDIHEIKARAFSGCSSLIILEIPKSVKTMYLDWYHPLTSLISLQIEDLYSWCSLISNNYVSSNNEKSRIHIFLYDDEIVDLKIPDGITSIGRLAFNGCDWIKSVTIPSSVTSIYSNTFTYCYNINSVTSLNPMPPKILNGTINTTYGLYETDVYKNATLYVPKGSKTLYWLHPFWENFKNIEEIDVDESSLNSTFIDLQKDGSIYNLNGIKVYDSALGKGIYIKNGKKVIIK